MVGMGSSAKIADIPLTTKTLIIGMLDPKILSYVLSAIVLLGMWLYGSKRLMAPLLSAIVQPPLAYVAYVTGADGFIPLNFCLMCIHMRNFWLWYNGPEKVSWL